jgi:hypothetical protein
MKQDLKPGDRCLILPQPKGWVGANFAGQICQLEELSWRTPGRWRVNIDGRITYHTSGARIVFAPNVLLKLPDDKDPEFDQFWREVGQDAKRPVKKGSRA